MMKDWFSTLFGIGTPRKPYSPPETCPSYIVGSTFEDCFSKDKELFWVLSSLTMSEFVTVWSKVYPEDFPNGGQTSLGDRTAVQPKTLIAEVDRAIHDLMADIARGTAH